MPEPAVTTPTDDLLNEIETGDLACEYQPIIATEDESVWGYEALARFSVRDKKYAPDEVFQALHAERERFITLETRAKRFQLANRPKGARLFVNLDPDVCEGPVQVAHWIDELGGADELIVEIIEWLTRKLAHRARSTRAWTMSTNLCLSHIHFVTVMHMLLVVCCSSSSCICLNNDNVNEVTIAARGGPTLSQPTPS